MRSLLLKHPSGVLLAGLALAALAAPAHADTLTMDAQWFSIAANADFHIPDNGCCNVYTNEVQSALGPNGFPVYNSGYGGRTLQDVNSTTGELTWWNPALNPAVTATGTGVITLPYSNPAMFAPNGSGLSDQSSSNPDGGPFLGAIFTGILNVPMSEQVSFSLGSDDDSFLYLGTSPTNGTIVDDLGGVHPLADAPVETSTLGPGLYYLTLFYVDRQPTNAALDFAVATPGVGLAATTPLPAALLLFAGGLSVMGFFARRKKRKLATS